MSNEQNEVDYGSKVVPVDFLSRRRVDGHPEHSGHPLKSGGGDGTSGDMERRLALVEDSLSELRRDIGEVKVSLATLTERVSHLPGKGFVVTAAFGLFTGLAALIAFTKQIQDLVN